MPTALGIINFIVSNYGAMFAASLGMIGAVSGLLGAILVIALIIPGDQPDKALQAAIDFLAKLSRK